MLADPPPLCTQPNIAVLPQSGCMTSSTCVPALHVVSCAALQVDKALKGEGHSLDLTPDAPDTATDATDAVAAKDPAGASAV